MRALVFGLALIPFIVCSVSASEAQSSTESDKAVQKPSSSNQQRFQNNKKHILKTQSRPAEAYAAEHSANLPVPSAPKTEAPAANSWTGFYVGAGAGVGRQ